MCVVTTAPCKGHASLHSSHAAFGGVVQRVAGKLLLHADMLYEYFGMQVLDSSEGPRLQQLPLLVDQHTPCLLALPEFVLTMALEVCHLPPPPGL